MLEDSDGTLLLGSYSSPYSGFSWSEIGSVEDLMAATAAGNTTPDWLAWGLTLLGVGGAAAIFFGGHGGSGGGGGGGADTTPPDAPSDLAFNPTGTVLSGRGEPGTTVTVKDAGGRVIGVGTVGSDGSFQVALTTAQTNGETVSVTLTDPSGNVSAPGEVTAGDTTAPAAPTDLAVSADGTTVSGKGEPNTTVTIKDANGNVIGTGTVGADGTFQVTLTTPQTNGETLTATLTDAAGNVSAPASVDAGDTTAPAAPTDLSISADGATVSGKGEPNTTVTIKNAGGDVVGTGTVGADGTFQVTLIAPLTHAEALTTTLTDAAGNFKGYRGSAVDISAQYAYETQIARQSQVKSDPSHNLCRESLRSGLTRRGARARRAAPVPSSSAGARTAKTRAMPAGVSARARAFGGGVISKSFCCKAW